MTFDVSKIFRRIRAIVTYARILFVDDSGDLQILQIEGYLAELRDGVERLGEYGFASNPPSGSQALVLALGGSRARLVAVATENRLLRPKNLPSGAVEIYSVTGARVRINADGTIEIDGVDLTITALGDVEITATGEASITAPVVRLGGVSEIDGIAFAGHFHDDPVSGVTGPAQGVGVP